MVFNQVLIQMYFTPEDFFYLFIRLLSQVFIRDAPGISEKDENRSKSTKVTKEVLFVKPLPENSGMISLSMKYKGKINKNWSKNTPN